MESIFFPIVKQGKLDDFKAVWGNFFVLTNTIEDEKKPGLLKTEFTTTTGEIVALCPKNYQMHCRVKNEIKEAKKGIPYSYEVKLDDFKSVLYGENTRPHMVEVRSLRLNTKKEMTRTTLRKMGLSDIHVKMAVQSDKVTCLPLKVNEIYL